MKVEDARSEADYIWSCRDMNCEAGNALRRLIRILAHANLQEADDDNDSDEQQEAKVAGETVLFLLATKLTNGYRVPTDER